MSGLTVAENIFLGHEEQFVHFGIKITKAMNRKATELLKKYGFDRIKASDIIDNYNFEDRKLVGDRKSDILRSEDRCRGRDDDRIVPGGTR